MAEAISSWASDTTTSQVDAGAPSWAQESKPKGTSTTKAFVKSAAESTLPAVAGLSAFGTGATLGAEVGTVIAPGVGTALGAIAGGAISALGAGYLASGAQEKILEHVPSKYKRMVGMDKATRSAEKQEHPYASFAGELAPNLAAFRPGKVADITLESGKTITGTAQRGLMATAMGGVEAGQELSKEGKVDPVKVLMAGAMGAVSTTPTKLGNKLLEATTPGFKPKVEVPSLSLKETGFRNRETGEIIPSGNRHNEDLKKWPQSFEQGFITQDGTFLNRFDAASSAKQYHSDSLKKEINYEGKGKEREPGLHSTDFGEAGLTNVKTKIKQEAIPEHVKQADNIIRTRINNVMATDRIISNTSKIIADTVPQVTDREAISMAIDLGEVDKLSPQHQEVTRHVQDMYADIGTRAKEAGVLEGMRENYINHIVDWKKSGQTPTQEFMDYIFKKADSVGGGTSPKSRFGKERKYDTFNDLHEALKETGLEIKTKDVSELYNAYASSMERAIENKHMIDNLKSIEVEGNPLVQSISKDKGIPKDWVVFNSPQLRGSAVHPELAPAMKFIFENPQSPFLMEAANTLSQAVKRINVGASAFHAKSLIESYMGNLGVLKASKNLTLAGIDKLFKTELSPITKALELYRKGGLGDEADSFIKAGLVASVPEDILKGTLGHLGAVGDALVSKFGPKTSNMEKALTKAEQHTLGVLDKFTWDYLHTGLKMQTALHEFEKAKLKNPEIDDHELRTEIARHVNNSFGGLNWFDVASQAQSQIGRELAMSTLSPHGRKTLQLLLFAPDWTTSTLRAFTTAFTGTNKVRGITNPTKQGDFARRYQMRVALAYATLINGINYAMSGHPIWDNKDKTRIEFKDGTSMQAAKHAMEPWHWIADPDQTLANKLGFVPKATFIGLGGLQYASPYAPKLQDTSGKGRLEAILGNIMPFSAESLIDAPKGQGVKRALLGAVGLPVYGKTKQQKQQEALDRKLKKLKELE